MNTLCNKICVYCNTPSSSKNEDHVVARVIYSKTNDFRNDSLKGAKVHTCKICHDDKSRLDETIGWRYIFSDEETNAKPILSFVKDALNKLGRGSKFNMLNMLSNDILIPSRNTKEGYIHMMQLDKVVNEEDITRHLAYLIKGAYFLVEGEVLTSEVKAFIFSELDSTRMEFINKAITLFGNSGKFLRAKGLTCRLLRAEDDPKAFIIILKVGNLVIVSSQEGD